MTNRFDLEQGILQCWNITSDIQLVYSKINEMTPDERENALLGLYTLYELKFEKLFDDFETLIQNKKIL